MRLSSIILTGLIALICFPFAHTIAQAGYSTTGLAMGKQRAKMGMIPASREVVVEEYFNYHTHDIALPQDGEAIGMDMRFGHLQPDTEDAILQIGLRTPDLMKYDARPRLNVSIVVDRSGSMSGERIQKTREAMKAFVQQLREDDILSIVLFDHTVEVVFRAQEIQNEANVLQVIDRIFVRGSTNLNLGIVTGYQEVLKNYSPNHTNRLVILTDAMVNTGELNPTQIMRNSQAYDQDRQVDFALIGVGSHFNHDLARNLTENGRNTIHFIADPNDIKKVFIDEVEALIAPVAKDIALTIHYPTSLTLKQFYGYDATFSPGKITLPLNNINRGLTQVILASFEGGNKRDRAEITATLSYFDLAGGQQVRQTMNVREDIPHWRRNIRYGAADYDLEMGKNHCIAQMAQSFKEMALLHEKGEHRSAEQLVSNTIYWVENRYAGKTDQDVKRVLDILKAYHKDLVEIADRG